MFRNRNRPRSTPRHTGSQNDLLGVLVEFSQDAALFASRLNRVGNIPLFLESIETCPSRLDFSVVLRIPDDLGVARLVEHGHFMMADDGSVERCNEIEFHRYSPRDGVTVAIIT